MCCKSGIIEESSLGETMSKLIKVILCISFIFFISNQTYLGSSANTTYYSDGSIKTKTSFLGGKISLRYTYYDGLKKTTGSKYKLETFNSQGKHQLTYIYTKNGKLKYKFTYNNNLWNKRITYKNGKTEEVLWRNSTGKYIQRDRYYLNGRLASRYKYGYNNLWNYRIRYYTNGKTKDIVYRDSRGYIRSQKKYYSNGIRYYSQTKVTKTNVSTLRTNLMSVLNKRRSQNGDSKLTYSSQLQAYCSGENTEYRNQLVAFFQSYHKYPNKDQEYYMAHNGTANKLMYEDIYNKQTNLRKIKISYRRSLANIDANQILSSLLSNNIDKENLDNEQYKYYAVSIINKDDYNFVEVCYAY